MNIDEHIIHIILLHLVYLWSPTSCSDCPNGWKLFQNHCYLMPSKPIILQQSTWHDARSFCVASGADLVSLNSQTEESFVNKQIEIWGNYLYYWIGLTDEDVEGKWKWTDGSPVNYTNFTRTQGFNDSQVNGTNFTGSQINTERLDFVRVENGIWKYSDDMYPDINSGRWMALICESSGKNVTSVNMTYLPDTISVPGCPPRFLKFQGNCYFMYSAIVSRNWGQRYCGDYGAFLTSIHSTDEQEFILQSFIFKLPFIPIWLGLSDKTTDGHLVWSDRSNVTFTKFGSSARNSLDFVVIDRMTGLWKYYNHTSAVVVCKRPVSNCPPSENMWNFWIQFQNYCYFRSSFVRAWNEARSHCLTRGSNLISIHNEEENKFLSMAIYAKTWLGLNDQNHEGQLKWTDKSPLTYTNYRNGTQNLDKLDYLVLQESGKWTFDDGTSYTAIICKRNAFCGLGINSSGTEPNCPELKTTMKTTISATASIPSSVQPTSNTHAVVTCLLPPVAVFLVILDFLS